MTTYNVDVLVPAALEGVIGSENVDQIRAPIVLEVANGPVRSEVDAQLEERGVVVVPDILANAGGVIVSYFEWVQNRQGYAWSLQEVRDRLGSILSASFDEVWEVSDRDGVSLRTAAYVTAMHRIEAVVQAQGDRDYFLDAAVQ